MTAAERALNLLSGATVVGLGTGRAATEFVRALGDRVRGGLKLRGVPTSQATADLATQLGIPLATLEEVRGAIDVTFDGADEVDPKLDLIKGYGGALVREKIVAAASKRFVVLVGAEKLVSSLGQRGRLPVEVIPFALPLCERRLEELGLRGTVRATDGRPYVTDNGNYILDCAVKSIADPGELDARILSIPGVLGTGLFAGMADVVLIQDGDRVEEMHRAS